jgi:hypothetical protein
MARGNNQSQSSARSEFSKKDRGENKAYNPANFRRTVEANAATQAINEGGLKNFADDELRISAYARSEGISRQDAQDIVDAENSKRVTNADTQARAKEETKNLLDQLNQISGIGLTRLTGAKNYQVADLGKEGSMLVFDLPAGGRKSYNIGIKYERRTDTYGLNISENKKGKPSVYSAESGLDSLEITRTIREKTGVAMSLQG